MTHSQDIILCFGNLPPLFKTSGKIIVFVQNRYLLDTKKLGNLPFKTKIRLELERYWFSRRLKTVSEFIVQTSSMKNLLEKLTHGDIPVRVLPFMNNSAEYSRKSPFRNTTISKNEKEFNFLYVASGESHKNHKQLVEAWCLLAKEGIFPSLKLTLDSFAFKELCSWTNNKCTQHGLNLTNIGNIPHEEVQILYKNATALIYPSTFESFGLPLIEARQLGLAVLASELDYVRDLLNPEQTFDPESAISIARAVKRFIGFEEAPIKILDAEEFINEIINK